MGHGRPAAGGKGCLHFDPSAGFGGTGIMAQGAAPPQQLPGPQLAPLSTMPSQSLSMPSQTSGVGWQQVSSTMPLQSLSMPSHVSGDGPTHPMHGPHFRNSPDPSQVCTPNAQAPTPASPGLPS